MSASIIRADSRHLPLADDSVDLVVTSPPYFGLRSYQDGGEHYDGQIGDEPTPAEFLDALLEVTSECVRVLKPSGSLWVNLGDKYVADNRGSGADVKRGQAKHAPRGPLGFVTGGMRQKSLMGLPWRYAIRCIDELGLILRAEVIWSKPNGLPESVTDRVRRSHEQWFHFTLEPRYYSAVDEVREEYAPAYAEQLKRGQGRKSNLNHPSSHSSHRGGFTDVPDEWTGNPLGKLPGSVWTVPTEPLDVPAELGVDHFAAFPTELPRRIIAGWSPREVCTACGEGRRRVAGRPALDMSRAQARRAHQLAEEGGLTEEHLSALLSVGISDVGRGAATQSGTGKNSPEVKRLADEARAVLGGYAREYLLRRPTALIDTCGCPDTSAPSTPGVVLDPFGGTGTTALVATALGRHGITVDMSADYCRLATWRTSDPKQLAKAARKPFTPSVEVPVGQTSILDMLETTPETPPPNPAR